MVGFLHGCVEEIVKFRGLAAVVVNV